MFQKEKNIYKKISFSRKQLMGKKRTSNLLIERPHFWPSMELE